MNSERKKRRWWVWMLGGLATLLVLIAVAGYVVLDRYATDIVVQALADANLPDPRLQVDSVGLSESRLSDVRIGADDALTADTITLDYDLLDLVDLDPSDLAIRLVRPTLKLALDENGAVSFGSLDALLASPSGGDEPLPFGEVVLDNARLDITTPYGEIEARADGRIENRGGDGLKIEISISAESELGRVNGSLDLTVSPTGAIDGRGTVRSLDAQTPWGAVEGGQGSIAIQWTGEGLPQGGVELTLASLRPATDLLPEQLASGGGGMQLQQVSLSARFDGTALSAIVSVADGSGDNAASIEIAIPDALAGGEATVIAEMSTAGDQFLWLWQDDWTGSGSLTASIEATATLPPMLQMLTEPAVLADIGTGRMSAQWILSEATLPGIARQVSAIGEIQVALVEGIATLTGKAPIELRIGALDPAVHAGLSDADPAWAPILARSLAGHIDVAVEGRGDRPFSMTLARRDEGWTVRGDATVLVATGEGPLVAVELTGNATAGETLTVAIDDLSLFASDIETPAAAVGVLEVAGRFGFRDGVPDFDLAGAATELSFADPALSFPRVAIELAMSQATGLPDGAIAGPILMSFADSGGAIEEVLMTGLSGELAGRLVWDHGVGRLYFTENAVFRVESMDIDGDVLIPEPAIVRVLASENPVLELDLNDAAGWSLRHSLNVGPLDVQGSIRMGDDRVQTTVLTRELLMEGGYLEGRYVMRIDIAGVSGTAPQRGWAIAGAGVVIEYDDNDTENLIVLQANASDLRMDEIEGAFSRIGMRGRMDYGLNDVIRFTARVFDERNLLIADVTARHDVNTNTGVAEVEVQDLIFSPVVLQPGEISPWLDGFENVTGTADISGNIRWTESGITPELALLVSDVSGSYDDVEFTRVNTVIELASLSPLETDPGQLLSIATVDPGVPISNASVTFAIEGGEMLTIDSATFDFAGGVVTAAEQAISFVAEEQELILTVTGVDLDTLLAFADLENLQAQGTLDGGIPIVIVNGDVVIPEAWLSAREPGFIRYDSGADLGAIEGANEGVDLMIELLENFLFDELDLRLMRPVAGDMQVGFRILGRNPEVYGGVPIDLTLNVDGELEEVIRNSLEIYRVPEAIQDLIMEYGFETATPSN